MLGSLGSALRHAEVQRSSAAQTCHEGSRTNGSHQPWQAWLSRPWVCGMCPFLLYLSLPLPDRVSLSFHMPVSLCPSFLLSMSISECLAFSPSPCLQSLHLEKHTYIYVYICLYICTHKSIHMGGCQNYGPLLGPLNTRCRMILRTLKGTISLTTTHVMSLYLYHTSISRPPLIWTPKKGP